MNTVRVFLFLIIVFTTPFVDAKEPASVEQSKLGNTKNVHACGSLFLAGQPTQTDISVLKSEGIQRVITLRTEGEVDWDEEAAVLEAGMEFIHIPIGGPESLNAETFAGLRKLLGEAQEHPTLLHCGSANRVGAVWLAHRVLDEGVDLETATKEAKLVGLRSAALESKAIEYIRRNTNKQSVRPGINDNFLKGDLDISQWLGRFEVESREVYAARNEIIAAMNIPTGGRIADVGAGTGFFSRLFTDAVGERGWVFAVDIAPRFVQHINSLASKNELANMSVVLCRQDSITLPPESVDMVFICDTYHHFEYPDQTLVSIHRALKPDGTLFVIDFDRIPGKSREFILSHVRAGKDVFRSEMEAAGFVVDEEIQMEQLKENYFLKLKKR